MSERTAAAVRQAVPARAWVMLAIGVAAQAATTVLVSAPALLIPYLHLNRGLSLVQAGALAGAPTFGLVLTLIGWGFLADRFGERWVIAGGLALAAAAALVATLPLGYVGLGLAFLAGGMAAGSTNAASGRVVVGWFPKSRRGLAMGIRQMSQPLGVSIAAILVPGIAERSGISAALFVPVVLLAVLAVVAAVGIVNPPRAVAVAPGEGGRSSNPYRTSGFLWRIHLVSLLLVVPQFTLSTFGLIWLVTTFRMDVVVAGTLVGIAQFVGAIGRIGVGVGSDRVGSRVRPLRWVAVSAVAVMLVLAIAGAAPAWVAVVVFMIATAITVADNGLAFTVVAEMAGPAWAGRALGAQNTGQFLAAAAVGPGVGALIATFSFPLAFVLVAISPALAVPLIPRTAAEHDHL